MKLTPYIETLKKSDAEAESEFIPGRAAEVEAQLRLDLAKQTAVVLKQKNEIAKLQRGYPLNSEALINAIDEYELANRKGEQLKGLVDQLFPSA